MKSLPFVSRTLLLLLSLTTVYGCQSNEQSTVNITMHKWPGYFHAFIAEEKGFFADEGVKVKLELYEGIDDSLKNFETNDFVDAAFGLQSDAMLLFAKGVPLQIVYIADFSNGGDVVISQPSIDDIKDLRGKTISVDKLNSFNHIFIVELLSMNGLKESDVNIVPFSASEVPQLLASGAIDAGQTWEPYQSQALAGGKHLLASTADAPGIVTDVLMFKTRFIEERPEDVKRILRALFKALDHRKKNPPAAYAIMSKATGVPAGSLRGTLMGNIFPNLAQNKKSFKKSDDLKSLFHSGKIISDFFIAKKVISSPIDLEKLHSQEMIQTL